jgi:hypothetical protein
MTRLWHSLWLSVSSRNEHRGSKAGGRALFLHWGRLGSQMGLQFREAAFFQVGGKGRTEPAASHFLGMS